MVHNLNNTLSFDEIQGRSRISTDRPVDRAPAHPHTNHTQGAHNRSTPVPHLLATADRTHLSVGIFPLWRIAGPRFQGTHRTGGNGPNGTEQLAMEGLDALLLASEPEDATRGTGWVCNLCRRSGCVPSVCGARQVPARRQKRDVWVGEVSD